MLNSVEPLTSFSRKNQEGVWPKVVPKPDHQIHHRPFKSIDVDEFL
jgi:hypothetical protein